MQYPRRFLIFDVFLLCVLAAIFFSAIPYAIPHVLRIWCFRVHVRPIVCILLASSLLGLTLGSSLPQKIGHFEPFRSYVGSVEEVEAFEFIRNEQGFFRIMSYNRYHAWFPIYTGKGSVDGWYDQAFPLVARRFTFHLYYRTYRGVDCNVNAYDLLGMRYILR